MGGNPDKLLSLLTSAKQSYSQNHLRITKRKEIQVSAKQPVNNSLKHCIIAKHSIVVRPCVEQTNSVTALQTWGR